jgi:leucyl/phenylalanyl-tRNA---protein transferase
MKIDVPSIVDAYGQGYFLMANDDDQLGWYRSHERTLIPLDDRFRYPTSLRRVLNQNRFEVAIDRAFDQVVEGCADRPETWISDDLKLIYRALHVAGWAHSFETWQGDRLAGGVLGIVIGGAFIGESMFFRIPEGSKVAMVKLVAHLRQQRFELFDAQLMNPHLERFGAYVVDAEVYDELLTEAIAQPCRFKSFAGCGG